MAAFNPRMLRRTSRRAAPAPADFTSFREVYGCVAGAQANDHRIVALSNGIRARSDHRCFDRASAVTVGAYSSRHPWCFDPEVSQYVGTTAPTSASSQSCRTRVAPTGCCQSSSWPVQRAPFADAAPLWALRIRNLPCAVARNRRVLPAFARSAERPNHIHATDGDDLTVRMKETAPCRGSNSPTRNVTRYSLHMA